MTIEEFKQILLEHAKLLPEFETQSGEAKELDIINSPAFQKACNMMASVISTSEAIAAHVRNMPRPIKTMRICKAQRRRISFWRTKMALIPFMGAVNLQSTLSQPYPNPNYKPGGICSNGPELFQGFAPRNMDLFVLPPDWDS